MAKVWLLFTLVAGLSTYVMSQGSIDPPADVSFNDFGSLVPGKINENIDTILRKFSKSMPSRLELGNIDDMFAYDCFLLGLDNGFRREGDAFLESPESTAMFLFGITTGRMTVECSWKTDMVILIFTGKFRANTDKVIIKANMTLEIEPGAEPQLQDLRVTHMDRVYTEISGAGFLNWLGEKFLNGLVNGARTTVIREIETDVRERLQKTLSVFRLPSL
ncbi:uncharacterized protein LOC135219365 [Macrobrachium nipponense]|uniref:uncharacterized protein LOC135219365 n=1 Tax=Macrobrachium nipponense TaxID=159736 RepID=UPI0030C87622